jgi:hypothetical protein
MILGFIVFVRTSIKKQYSHGSRMPIFNGYLRNLNLGVSLKLKGYDDVETLPHETL